MLVPWYQTYYEGKICRKVTFSEYTYNVYIRNPQILIKGDAIAIRGFSEECKCTYTSCVCFKSHKCCCVVYYFGSNGSFERFTIESVLSNPPPTLLNLLNDEIIDFMTPQPPIFRYNGSDMYYHHENFTSDDDLLSNTDMFYLNYLDLFDIDMIYKNYFNLSMRELNDSDEFLYALYARARIYPEYFTIVSTYIQCILYLRISKLMEDANACHDVRRLYMLINDFPKVKFSLIHIDYIMERI